MPDSRRKLWTWLSVALLCGILFFGLRPRDQSLANNVNWLKGQNGIHFRKYGIAYSPAFIDPHLAEENGLAIELALRPPAPHPDGFGFILALDNGDDARQLVLGQWRSWLILMNGDDYAHKKRLKRLSVDLAALPGDPLFLAIVSGAKGTVVYVNGKTAAARDDVVLKIPPGATSRLIVGNSAYGSHSWQGDVCGLALYGRELAAAAVAGHYRRWAAERHFGYTLDSRPLAAYFFDEKEGQIARDHAGGANLEIPRKSKALRRNILAPPWDDFEFDRDFIIDGVLNFLGFIPLGIALAASLARWAGRLKANALPVAVAIGVLTSLFIELSQSSMPSRSSSLLDLMLNSAGALAGALICRICAVCHHCIPQSQRKA